MDVSVIVACFENRDLLPLIMESLQRQTFAGSYEIVLCDDGSCPPVLDSTLLEYFPARASVEILCLWHPRSGDRRAKSRNNGIRAARGELLLFLDGDILAEPSLIEFHWNAHKDRERTAVAGTRRWVRVPERNWPKYCSTPLPDLWKSAWERPLDSDAQYQNREMRSPQPWKCVRGCNFSVRRCPEVYFDENFRGWFGEDWEIALRLWLRHGYTFRMVPSKGSLHIEKGDPKIPIADLMRVSTHEELAQYLHNLFYLQALYPECDTGALIGCLRCILAGDPPRWRLSARHEARGRSCTEAFRASLRWLQENRCLSAIVAQQIPRLFEYCAEYDSVREASRRAMA
jgi:hypothetical protein